MENIWISEIYPAGQFLKRQKSHNSEMIRHVVFTWGLFTPLETLKALNCLYRNLNFLAAFLWGKDKTQFPATQGSTTTKLSTVKFYCNGQFNLFLCWCLLFTIILDQHSLFLNGEVFPSNIESSKMICVWVTISIEKPSNLHCKHLFSFTLENTLILFVDSVNFPNMPKNISIFSHSFEFIMFLEYKEFPRDS